MARGNPRTNPDPVPFNIDDATFAPNNHKDSLLPQQPEDEVAFTFKNLEDFLNRAKTCSILGKVLFGPVVAVLVAAWTFALWKKHSRAAGPALGWRDAVALGVVVVCVCWRLMAGAIGLTAAYVAWSLLADMSWMSDGDLPCFAAFVAGLRAAGDNKTEEKSTSGKTVESDIYQDSQPEALVGTDTQAATPEDEKQPEEDCVVCWASDEPPLQLPCTHHVCLDCLNRLKAASRYQCPFCRIPLYSLRNAKVYLFQLNVALTGAQIALAIVRSALKVAQREYWGAAGNLFFNLFSGAAALYGFSNVHVLGEEGYFAGVSNEKLYTQLGTALHWVWWGYDGIRKADSVTVIDGQWYRPLADEWRSARDVLCWVAPKVAGYVAEC